MFERILLPLDGSQLAEMAVPYAEYFAQKLGSDVTLLNTCRSDLKLYSHMYQVYLDHVADGMRRRIGKARPKSTPPVIETKVMEGEPTAAICDFVKMRGITTIVMAAFGGSGLKTWQLGSVTDKRRSPLREKKGLINRILVPLDGSSASQLSVPYALALARKSGAGIALFGMVERADYYSHHVSFMPHTEYMAKEYARLDVTAKGNARAYLTGIEKKLRREGVRVTHDITLGLSPAREILEQEEKTSADLVVMATRGSSGINRWAFGSVTEKVLRGGKLPLFLVREAFQYNFLSNLCGGNTGHFRSDEYDTQILKAVEHALTTAPDLR